MGLQGIRQNQHRSQKNMAFLVFHVSNQTLPAHCSAEHCTDAAVPKLCESELCQVRAARHSPVCQHVRPCRCCQGFPISVSTRAPRSSEALTLCLSLGRCNLRRLPAGGTRTSWSARIAGQKWNALKCLTSFCFPFSRYRRQEYGPQGTRVLQISYDTVGMLLYSRTK